MPFDQRIRRILGLPSLAVALLAAASAGGLAAANHPALAATALAAVTSAVACATSTACVVGTNTGSGPGVSGSSAKGTAGVVGFTSAKYGVYGYTTGSTGGTGVYGTSVKGYGVSGTTTSGTGTGVYGNNTGSGTGVTGQSKTGTGVSAISASGYGLFAVASTPAATGIFVNSAGGNGIISSAHGSTAVIGANTNGSGGDFSGVVALSAESGDYPLVLSNLSTYVFEVDASGNVYYSGSLRSLARTAGGGTLTSFNAKLTAPTVEDTGTAQLVGGAAAVALDPVFAASIDPATVYRVFITPNGDTPHGLYVATKSTRGFVVREAQAGRSTVSFDYRIVATARGEAGERMSVTNGEALPRLRQLIASHPRFVSPLSIQQQ